MIRRLLIAVVSLMLVTSVSADELLEAAKRERARRASLKHRTRVLTNQGIGAKSGKSGGTMNVATAQKSGASSDKKDKEEEKEEGGQWSEWTGKFEDARQDIKDAEQELEDAEFRLMNLRTYDSYPDNPLNALNQKVDVDAAIADKADAEKSVASAKKALERLKEEARKAGVPAGFRR